MYIIFLLYASVYQEHGYENVHCANAEEIYSHIISLPLYPGLTSEQQDYVIDTLKSLCEE